MLPGGFPADDLFGPIVFRVAVRHAILMGDIKDGELAPLIVHGGDALRLAVHDRMLALDHAANLAQHRGEFRPWIQCGRWLMFGFPFSDLSAINKDGQALPIPLKEDRTARAQTMLEAHEALIKTAPENLPQFKDVIQYLEEELHLSK